MKRILFIVIILIPLFSIAQKQGNIWYFGNHAGLNFNNGNPIPLLNGATYNGYYNSGPHSEGTSVICDSTGALLFYTNGKQIWNRIHQIMPNGDSLLGHWSSTQAALIVPQPGSSRYFYVFTTDAFVEDSLKYGFRYSIVDICLDNGLGDIIKDKKNIKLLDNVAEKLTAVRHANNNDYWIIVHKYYSNAFYAYHLSSIGIIDTVISHIGSRHPNINAGIDTWDAIGQMKASPDGNKLAIVNGNAGAYTIAEYFNFDKNTAIVSNWNDLQTNLALQYQYYGVSFSPDNSKLYISCSLNGVGIYQFNLAAGNGNIDSVKASRTKITNYINYDNYALQLGIDGKIYVASNNGYLSAINDPNNPGLSCNFQDSAVFLSGRSSSLGLPNFIDSYDYSNTSYDCNNGIEEQTKNDEFIIFPNPSTNNIIIGCKPKSEIEILNISGQLIKTLNTNETNTTLDISAFASGMYFVKVKTEKGISVKKFIKE
jgi:hypothetical protein